MNDIETPTSLSDAKRTARIMAAAETLFLAHGMRRTSMDDIAREAGLAKGTLYLSFKSKEALFKALVVDIVERIQTRAAESAQKEAALLDKIVAYLDEAVGTLARLLDSSPHVGEVLDAKKELASSTVRKFETQTLRDLETICGSKSGSDLAVVLFEAAHGCKATGPLDSPHFRARLRRHVSVLLRGTGRQSAE